MSSVDDVRAALADELEGVKQGITEAQDQLVLHKQRRRELLLSLAKIDCPFEVGEEVGMKGTYRHEGTIRGRVIFRGVAWSTLFVDGYACYSYNRIKKDGSPYKQIQYTGTARLMKLT